MNIYIFKASLQYFFIFSQPFYGLMNDIHLTGSCQAHSPVQYASNIESIRQKWHWCCDWQRATPESYVQTSLLFAQLAVRVNTGCSAFPFNIPRQKKTNKKKQKKKKKNKRLYNYILNT